MPLSDFTHDRRSPNGYGPRCKECDREIHRKYRENIYSDQELHQQFLQDSREYYKNWIVNKREDQREKKRQYYHKKADDPIWMERRRQQQKERRMKPITKERREKRRKERISNLNLNSVNVSESLICRGFDLTGLHTHHWNYEKLKSVFLIPSALHRYLHRYLITNESDKHLYVREGNIKIETAEQAAEIFARILAQRGYNKPLVLVDFSEDETKVTEYSKWS